MPGVLRQDGYKEKQMTTMFRYGFQTEAWRPTLGQSTTDLANLLDTAGDAYGSYAAKEKAEADAKAAAANAAAARAQAAAAAAAGAKPQTGMILGMPANYVIFGGLGLAAAVVAVILLNKK